MLRNSSLGQVLLSCMWMPEGRRWVTLPSLCLTSVTVYEGNTRINLMISWFALFALSATFAKRMCFSGPLPWLLLSHPTMDQLNPSAPHVFLGVAGIENHWSSFCCSRQKESKIAWAQKPHATPPPPPKKRFSKEGGHAVGRAWLGTRSLEF